VTDHGGARSGLLLSPMQRLVPVRRLTAEECDRLGFAGPLVLSVRQMRWFGPWRSTRSYAVVRHPAEVVLSVSRRELVRLGVDPDRPGR
jgi:hypothetical protein